MDEDDNECDGTVFCLSCLTFFSFTEKNVDRENVFC